MKPIKKTVITLFFLMGFLVAQSQEKSKPSSSSPKMGTSSTTNKKRLASTIEPDREFSYAERELDYLTHIWEGEYDNVEQLDYDKIQQKEGEDRKHFRVHASVRQFQNSNFGVGAVYVEEYQNNNPSEITRQVIYQLIPDDAEKAIRIKVFHFKDKKAVLAAGKSFNEIANITPDSEKLITGCDLILRRQENGFLAKTINKECNINPNKKNETIDYQFGVGETTFGFQKIRYKSNVRLPDDFQTSAFALVKARCFRCMLDFPNETDGRSTVTKHYIDIYDQGGSFEFEYPDGRNMIFGMRNTWSFGMHRETFVIYLLDRATMKTLIYSWGNPGADRIGFNPGWIRAQCDLKTARNVKMQLELRPGS